MAHEVYDVYTNLDPQQLTELASETFLVWLKFALGDQELSGHKLMHPSGRYASALSWKKTGVAKVSIIADEDAVPEAGAIEYGRASANIKEAMLGGGNTHESADGYMYRVIPLRPDQWRPAPPLFSGVIVETAGGGRVRRAVAKMWAKPRPFVDSKSRFRTMSNRPGSSPWIVPEFHPYAPAKFLADLLYQEFGRGRA